jgi:hypothetical protein
VVRAQATAKGAQAAVRSVLESLLAQGAGQLLAKG